jgi:hypothetical protein
MKQVEATVGEYYNLAVRSCFSSDLPEFVEAFQLAGHA